MAGKASAAWRPLSVFALGLMGLAPCGARAQLAAPARASTPAPAREGEAAPAANDAELYLEVSIDGQDSGQVAPFTQGPRGLRTQVQALRDLGLDPLRFGVDGQDSFELDAVPSLTYTYDRAGQSIDLHLGGALRAPLALLARPTVEAGAGAVSPGALLNYDLYGQLGGSGGAALLHEARWFDAHGVLSSTGNLVLRGPQAGYVRYDTAWSHSDPASLATFLVGDTVTPSLSWTRSLRLGGVEWRKNFALRPDLLTYPLAALSGSAVVPSNVSLYVNGIQQYNAAVPSGPFVLNGVAGLNGAGQATIVTRDALGRAVSASVPLYVDTRMLAPGLVDYAFDLGALRRGYGVRSLAYDPAPVATGSLRYGLNERLTLEAHAETGHGLVNGGAGLLWRLGQLGVLSGSLAASQHGAQAALGYQYVSPRFSIDTERRRASRAYADLGTAAGTPVDRVSDRLNLNLALPRAQSLGLSYVATRQGLQDGRVRIASLVWSASVARVLYLSLSAYRDFKDRGVRGLAFSLSMSLGGHVGASANVGRQGNDTTRSVQLSRAPDYGGGFGWALQKGSSARYGFDAAQGRYLGNAGEVMLFTQSSGGARSTSVDASGAIVAMDGSVTAARQVGSGFALVSTGVAGVPVIHENREIGRTDASGHLLVPNLVPYMPNRIAIDTSNLPIDSHIGAASASVVPQRQAGVLASFKIERYAAATVTVQGADGKPMPDGTPVLNADSGAATVVGYDGVLFVDGLKEHNRLLLGSGAARCEVRFDYRPGPAGELPAIGPLACKPAGGIQPENDPRGAQQ
ncbi:fimbria/pilus outer membrane usher protein [Massilia sp. 9096]|uniref:fimbria/pilus outer membrane usher protein n=1 Tax=Massilia sp. 9096 TaxID=1500894 RepID=UPI0006904EFC|nr:fimbria/pilus outer membrane usher protein [Massilia sp. 9096]